ncbi:MAG: hypothetical protein J6S99_07400, partial [Bacteroidales bacterium]|nr:hypothetical protein [Bacteroidales bacterium]
RASLRLTPDGVPALRELPVSGLCLTQAPESPDAPRLRNAAVELRKGLLPRAPRGTLEITNDGASDLIIHAIELPEGVSHSGLDPESLRIAPGKSLKISLTARHSPAPTGESPRLTVFSNDPLRPAKEIPIHIL